ncbi:MAG: hypothetical protein QME81_02345 [bacterium]|nr:hypothetical protein [bacterium]
MNKILAPILSYGIYKIPNNELAYDPETHQYVAACPELDLAVAGDREEEAVEDLVEAIKEYAQDYLERLDLFAGNPNRGAHLPLILLIASCVGTHPLLL